MESTDTSNSKTSTAFALTHEVREAVRELLFKMADDALIIGHRNSEWVGIGPVLEEDIAFASIAQDQLGHALALYTILHEQKEFGEPDPDTLAFMRPEGKFRCCHLTQIPTQDYDIALMRHFLFDMAQALRFEALVGSAFEPLARVARKVRGEIRYHTLHAQVWVRQLGQGTDESKARMRSALQELYPLALGIFEPSKHESILIENGVFVGERELQQRWAQAITPVLEQADLPLASLPTALLESTHGYGGRYGSHTEHLAALVEEMSEVFSIDPVAEW
jgi:ring-1,2-phenylacetyl-CoA epoxidase subunit PaaC